VISHSISNGCIDLETKITAIEETEAGCTPRKDIAPKFGIELSTLST
jgi:hypothetical protein